MKTYFIIILLSIGTTAGIKAQDYKVNKTSGKIVINLPSVTVEGYSGSQVIFSSERKESEMDPRAKGLQAINGAGFIDNTGLGISVTENGKSLDVNAVASDLAIKILVPKGLMVSFEFHKVILAGKVYLKNLENEIVVSTDYNPVELENITGPVTARSIYGSIDATFGAVVKGPVSITSVYKAVDVAIPVSTKANLKLISSHGSILASAELKIELEKKGNEEMISYGSAVNGKLNGGGTDFKLSSDYGKIYLRKSK